MAKRNISYIKPKEPAFLARLKQEAGYKEGPTVQTKYERPPNYSDEGEDSDKDDERPVIVVLGEGDLTLEQAEIAKREEAADLSRRVLFKRPPQKKKKAEEEVDDGRSCKVPAMVSSSQSKPAKRAKSNNSAQPRKGKGPLSFGNNDDDDDE